MTKASVPNLINHHGQQAYPRTEHAGYVYAVEFRPMHVKIGRSRNPVARLNALASQSGANPLRTWVSPACYNHCDIELVLHDHFKSSRMIGEYFKIEFDEAVFVAAKLSYQIQSQEQDAILDAQRDERLERFGSKMSGWLVDSARDAAKLTRQQAQDDADLNSRRVSVCDVAKRLGVTQEDVIVTIGMSYDDFVSFGPFAESDEGILLNDMHVSFLVILLPTTDRTLPFKFIAAKLLATNEIPSGGDQ